VPKVDARSGAVLVDPGPREQVEHLRLPGGGMTFKHSLGVAVEALAEGDGDEVTGPLELEVKRVEKGARVVGVGAPCVLAVEDDGEDSLVLVVEAPCEAFADLTCEILRGGLGVAVAVVMEADVVRESRFSKEDAEVARGRLDSVRLAQHVRVVDAVSPAPAALEHAGVGGNPAHTYLGEERGGVLADGPFRRPHATWGAAE